MKRVLYVLILFSAVLIFTLCDHSPKLAEDTASYIASVEKWQQERLEGLKSKNGWLNLAGIYWLKNGIQTFGSDSLNDIVFPAKAPAFIGTLSLKDSLVHLEVNEAVELFYKNEPVKELDLTYDSSGDPSYITHGDFAWYIMKRHHSLAIRLRDYKNPAIEALDHIPSYPIDPAYLVEAELVPFEEVKTITVATPFQDYTQDYECPGELHFRLRGEKLTLLPFISGDTYFIIISDETSGLETYGGGRFMYTEAASSGSVLLDFNKAYNPPCAVTAFAACPMPPRENHLPVKIEAGEKVVQVPGK
jgi:uncharacterized protein (DUF1684 family)